MVKARDWFKNIIEIKQVLCKFHKKKKEDIFLKNDCTNIKKTHCKIFQNFKLVWSLKPDILESEIK